MSKYYRTLMLVAYSSEQALLKRYLEQGFDPYDYGYELEQWLEEDLCPECGTGDAPDCEECKGKAKAALEAKSGYDPSAWLETASDADIVRFREHLESSGSFDGGTNSPAYEHLVYNRLVKPTWLVHFTDEPDSIAADGFKHGFEDMIGLGLTTESHRKRGPGYNFAFILGLKDARDAARGNWGAGDSRYGTHAVVFWGGGVEAWHIGDEENQIVFWGPEVSPSRIFPIHKNKYTGWHVEDAVGRVVFGYDDYGDGEGENKEFEETAEWVVANHNMLSSTREKAERRKRDRAAALKRR